MPIINETHKLTWWLSVTESLNGCYEMIITISSVKRTKKPIRNLFNRFEKIWNLKSNFKFNDVETLLSIFDRERPNHWIPLQLMKFIDGDQ